MTVFTANHWLQRVWDDHIRLLGKIAWVYSGSVQDREDLLQEMALRLWTHREEMDPERVPSTWIYRVALNVAIDYSRRRRRKLREIPVSSMETTASLDPAVSGDAMIDLHQLLAGLPEVDRSLVLMKLEGNSYREIAEVHGISESLVGTRLNRIKNQLRQKDKESKGDHAS